MAKGDLTAKFSASTADFEAGVNRIKTALNSLNASLNENKQKTKETNDEIKGLKKQQTELENFLKSGVNSPETEKALKGVNDKLKEATNRLAELKTEEQLLKVQVNDANKELKDQYASLHNAGEKALSLGDIIKANLISDAIVSGVKRLGSALKSLVFDSAAAVDDINTMSAMYGMSAQDIQKFQYASDLIDVSVETLSTTMARNIRSMDNYRKGTTDIVNAYKTLKVEVLDANGELRDSEVVYNEVIAALGRMANETERDAVAMRLLGRSAQEINPLILGGADALAELGEQAEKLGLILSEEQLDNLNALNDKIDVTKANFNALGMVIAEEFSKSFDGAFEAGDELIEFIQQLKADGTLREMAEETASAIKNVVSVAKTAITLGWEFKNVLLSGAAAVISYNVAFKSFTAIDTTIRNFAKLKTAIDNATGAANKLKAAFSVTSWIGVASLIASVVVPVIINLVSSMNKANEATLESARASQEKAEASKQEYEELKKLADEYEKLGGKTIITGDEKNRLADIQDILNDKYLTEAERIDLVNGKYDEQIGKLRELSKKQLDEAYFQAKIAKSQAETAFNKTEKERYYYTFYKIDYEDDFFKFLHELENAKMTYNGETNIEIKGNAQQRLEAQKQIIDYMMNHGMGSGSYFNQLVEDYENSKEIVESYASAVENLSSIENLMNKTTEGTSDNVEAATNALDEYSTATESASKSLSDLIKSSKDYTAVLKEQYDNGKLSAETVSAMIEAGKQSALIIDKETGLIKLNAEAHRDLTVAELEAARAKLTVRRVKLITEYSDNKDEIIAMGAGTRKERLEIELALKGKENIEAELAFINNLLKDVEAEENNILFKSVQTQFENAAKDRIKLINEEISAKEKAKKAAIDAINAEVEARKRLNEDKKHQDEIDKINARLKYEQMDDLSRKELERQKQELQQEREELEFQRNAEDKKSAIETNFASEKENLTSMITQLNDAMTTLSNWTSDLSEGVTTISNIVNSNNTTSTTNKITTNPIFNFGNTNLTAGQLIELFKKAVYDATY